MEKARMVANQGERNTSEAEQLLYRLEQTVRETLSFLELDGADALNRAVEQSKQFGIQSERMSEIAARREVWLMSMRIRRRMSPMRPTSRMETPRWRMN